jgi:hypothetical protein
MSPAIAASSHRSTRPGGCVEHCASAGGKPSRPREHRVANRLGQDGGAGAEHLGDVERIPPGESVQCRRVEIGAHRQLGNGGCRQWLQPETAADGCGQLAQPGTQWVVQPDLVVAEAGDEQGRMVGDATAEEREHVQRGLVGPVRILDDQHDGSALAVRAIDEGECRGERFCPAHPGF